MNQVFLFFWNQFCYFVICYSLEANQQWQCVVISFLLETIQKVERASCRREVHHHYSFMSYLILNNPFRSTINFFHRSLWSVRNRSQHESYHTEARETFDEWIHLSDRLWGIWNCKSYCYVLSVQNSISYEANDVLCLKNRQSLITRPIFNFLSRLADQKPNHFLGINDLMICFRVSKFSSETYCEKCWWLPE